jgi:hypothetical protein
MFEIRADKGLFPFLNKSKKSGRQIREKMKSTAKNHR